jgi:prepilin-type N-terminal cleavage/methylation domain-containing protein
MGLCEKYLTQRHKEHKEKIMLFKTLPTTPKLISHTKYTKTQRKKLLFFSIPLRIILPQRYKRIICLNKKNKLSRVRQGLVHSVALCENKGFTLIEIIVALLIFSILSALLFSTFIQIQRNISENKWKNQLTEEGVKICNIIRLELTGAREIYYADQDSISFINQEGKLSSFCWKDSLLFKSNRNIVSADTKVISFRFIYYLSSDFIGESSQPIYFLPVDQISLKRLKVTDWEIGVRKGKNNLHLKTGAFIRNIRQQ